MARIGTVSDIISRFLLVIPLLLLAGCLSLPAPREVQFAKGELPAALDKVAFPADQLIVVVGEGPEQVQARLYTLERFQGFWREFLPPLRVSVGRKGFAPAGAKREGDGRTPSGLYPLEFVFGYAPEFTGKMPYRQATDDTLWVDDPNASDYNTWVRRGETTASSFETMKLPDRRYRHGVVIGYNRNPIVKGMGSAIFIHAWLKEGGATAGCVALDEEELVGIITWLDPAKHPHILMGNPSDLASLLENLKGAE